MHTLSEVVTIEPWSPWPLVFPGIAVSSRARRSPHGEARGPREAVRSTAARHGCRGLLVRVEGASLLGDATELELPLAACGVGAVCVQ